LKREKNLSVSKTGVNEKNTFLLNRKAIPRTNIQRKSTRIVTLEKVGIIKMIEVKIVIYGRKENFFSIFFRRYREKKKDNRKNPANIFG